MLITGLRAKNWGCHPTLDMKFKAGLNGVIGANGSGKSTVLDALRFGSTNESISPGQRSDNIRTGQKNGYVELDFTHGDSYTIRRTLENSKCKMTCGDKTWTKASEIDEFLEQLLQTKIDALLNNVFVGQHAIDDILFKTNTERLKEFQDTFGLTRMADAYRVLSTEISSCSVTPGLAAQRDLLVEAAKESHKELDRARDELRALTAQLNDLMGISEKVVLHESLLQLQDSRNKSLAVLTTLDNESKTLEKQLHTLNAEIEGLKLEIAKDAGAVIAAMTLIGSYTTAKAQRQSLSDELKRVSAVQKPAEVLADLQAELTRLSDRVQRLTAISKGELPLPQLAGDAELAAEYEEISTKIKADVGADIRMLEVDLARELGVLEDLCERVVPDVPTPYGEL